SESLAALAAPLRIGERITKDSEPRCIHVRAPRDVGFDALPRSAALNRIHRLPTAPIAVDGCVFLSLRKDPCIEVNMNSGLPVRIPHEERVVSPGYRIGSCRVAISARERSRHRRWHVNKAELFVLLLGAPHEIDFNEEVLVARVGSPCWKGNDP